MTDVSNCIILTTSKEIKSVNIDDSNLYNYHIDSKQTIYLNKSIQEHIIEKEKYKQKSSLYYNQLEICKQQIITLINQRDKYATLFYNNIVDKSDNINYEEFNIDNIYNKEVENLNKRIEKLEEDIELLTKRNEYLIEENRLSAKSNADLAEKNRLLEDNIKKLKESNDNLIKEYDQKVITLQKEIDESRRRTAQLETDSIRDKEAHEKYVKRVKEQKKKETEKSEERIAQQEAFRIKEKEEYERRMKVLIEKYDSCDDINQQLKKSNNDLIDKYDQLNLNIADLEEENYYYKSSLDIRKIIICYENAIKKNTTKFKAKTRIFKIIKMYSVDNIDYNKNLADIYLKYYKPRKLYIMINKILNKIDNISDERNVIAHSDQITENTFENDSLQHQQEIHDKIDKLNNILSEITDKHKKENIEKKIKKFKDLLICLESAKVTLEYSKKQI